MNPKKELLRSVFESSKMSLQMALGPAGTMVPDVLGLQEVKDTLQLTSSYTEGLVLALSELVQVPSSLGGK